MPTISTLSSPPLATPRADYAFSSSGPIHANLCPAELVQHALRRQEGLLSEKGALVAYTGERTGRSPKDRYLVTRPGTREEVCWGPINRPMEPELFDRLYTKGRHYLEGRELFIQDGWACADPRYRLGVRVVAELAWHALFARCLLLRPSPQELGSFQPQLTVIHASGLQADPREDGTRTGVFIVLDLEQRLVLIGGTRYAGEIKKSVFSVLNYWMPRQDVLPMHCAANKSPAGDTALFFGLSGTGKTTLSADPERRLIGDDEHGWSPHGIFNFEGGCYAKTIRLSQSGEPQIWNAIRFGSVLENVVLDPETHRPNYDDAGLTENTRAAYPIDFIDGCDLSGQGGHPSHILFLTCDTFGVLPPVNRLTLDQAVYYFLSGYTAKVAGTEGGVSAPEATFSACFAAPFLPLPPVRYAQALADRLRRHRPGVWLVNTGWTGGPFGQGRRIPLDLTRTMVRAIVNGRLQGVSCVSDPTFGLRVPTACPDVPLELLQPRSTWSDPAAYDAGARHLSGLFRANFRQYEDHVPEEVRRAGPRT
jgi:phosphoenolpyruvate carboxykinase (ATP)